MDRCLLTVGVISRLIAHCINLVTVDYHRGGIVLILTLAVSLTSWLWHLLVNVWIYVEVLELHHTISANTLINALIWSNDHLCVISIILMMLKWCRLRFSSLNWIICISLLLICLLSRGKHFLVHEIWFLVCLFKVKWLNKTFIILNLMLNHTLAILVSRRLLKERRCWLWVLL